MENETLDAEVLALGKIIEILNMLEVEAALRIVAYVESRFAHNDDGDLKNMISIPDNTTGDLLRNIQLDRE